MSCHHSHGITRYAFSKPREISKGKPFKDPDFNRDGRNAAANDSVCTCNQSYKCPTELIKTCSSHLGCGGIEEQAPKCALIKFESCGWTWHSIPVCATIGLRHQIVCILLLFQNNTSTQKSDELFMETGVLSK
jgi:hypothetical protein